MSISSNLKVREEVVKATGLATCWRVLDSSNSPSAKLSLNACFHKNLTVIWEYHSGQLYIITPHGVVQL